MYLVLLWLLFIIMEKITNNNNKTKLEPNTLKSLKTSKSTAPKAQVHVISTPAKASEQRSRVSPKHHKDQTKWWAPGQGVQQDTT